MKRLTKPLILVAAAAIAGISTYSANNYTSFISLQLADIEALSSYEYRIRIDYNYTQEKLGYEDQEFDMPCKSTGSVCSIEYKDPKGHTNTITITNLKN